MGIDVTAITTKSDFEKLRSDIEKSKKNQKKEFILDGERKFANSIVPYKINDPDAFAWQSASGIYLHLFRAGHIYRFGPRGDKDFTEKAVSDFLKNFRARQIFEMPKEKGICIPYGIWNIDNEDSRSVGVTMRLEDRPDVEIFFQDEMERPPQTGDANLSEELTMSYFWEEENRGMYKEVHYDWPKYRQVKLAGREGHYTTVTLVRPDGSKDFGYMAYNKGDPNAAIPTPNLKLYLIRTASRANAAGKTPVTESELKQLAAQIATSVRRRPSDAINK